ncbi:MAG: hypothetical protein ACO3OC_10565 [Ilumatobacteraceae bacterium]
MNGLAEDLVSASEAPVSVAQLDPEAREDLPEGPARALSLRHSLRELTDPAREVAEVLACRVCSEPEGGEGVGADPGLDREVAQLVSGVGDILPEGEERTPRDYRGAKSGGNRPSGP